MSGNINRKKEAVRSIKFFLFSISAGVIELGVFALFETITDWPYWPRYLIALICSVLWNFTLNRRYTFKSANNVPIAMLKVALFYCVFTPVTTISGNFLAESCGWNDYLVTILNMLCNFITEFLYDRFFVFGKTLDTNALAQKEREKAAVREEE
ncbi:MAG: GtrA family protein [Eubacterium sp.]|jgi:putative flippase GtrA|nr:GtrA family protein [Eubacterium sp.]MCH4047598.1 GtrA family protein [Eubacterium sp.]MCH4078370.1 GtrA family protein [Eubacterium sp.]MCH4109514.1 GtrA family protein [Eubacterium sp.]MCI1306610.1 GtrA family protein [Eubacterium sp.]